MTKHDWKVGDRARVTRLGNVQSYNHYRGTEGTIQTIFSPTRCTLRTHNDFLVLDSDILDPIPAETPKDPFTPGEYVTCVEGRDIHGTREGDVLRVDGYPHWEKNCFCAMGEAGIQGYEKSKFRPATPEEIAAYKAKYEAEPAVDPQPEPYPTPEPRITFTVGGQEFYVGQRVWVVNGRADVISSGQELTIVGSDRFLTLLMGRKENSSITFPVYPTDILTTSPTPHEWKRGDWARHNEFGECFVCSGVDFAGEVRVDFLSCSSSVKPETLTFIKHIDLPS